MPAGRPLGTGLVRRCFAPTSRSARSRCRPENTRSSCATSLPASSPAAPARWLAWRFSSGFYGGVDEIARAGAARPPPPRALLLPRGGLRRACILRAGPAPPVVRASRKLREDAALGEPAAL